MFLVSQGFKTGVSNIQPVGRIQSPQGILPTTNWLFWEAAISAVSQLAFSQLPLQVKSYWLRRKEGKEQEKAQSAECCDAFKTNTCRHTGLFFPSPLLADGSSFGRKENEAKSHRAPSTRRGGMLWSPTTILWLDKREQMEVQAPSKMRGAPQLLLHGISLSALKSQGGGCQCTIPSVEMTHFGLGKLIPPKIWLVSKVPMYWNLMFYCKQAQLPYESLWVPKNLGLLFLSSSIHHHPTSMSTAAEYRRGVFWEHRPPKYLTVKIVLHTSFRLEQIRTLESSFK